MSQPLLETMKTWLQDNNDNLRERNIRAEVSEVVEGEPTSARIDFESTRVFGRVTLWSNGFCDLEKLSTESGEQLMWKHLDAVDRESLERALTEFAAELLDVPGRRVS